MPQAMLDKCVAAINASGGVTANYSIITNQGTSSGTIAMQGKKFRVLSPDAKCWYDGKTQWSWSPLTGEVNITTPDQEELQMTNPLAAVQHFKANFTMKKAKAKTAKIDETTSLLRTARFDMKDKSVYTVSIKGYKHKSLPASTFTFDKSQVPAGTEVVDLR